MVSDLLFLWPWCFSYIHVSKDHSVSHSEKQSWQSGFKYCKVNKEQTKYTLKKSPPKISPQLLVHMMRHPAPPLPCPVPLPSYTDVSDWSFMTNLWLLGSINSSAMCKKGSGVTVTIRERSRRLRQKTWPWRKEAVTGSSLTSVHWRPLLLSRYCRVGPGTR